MQLRIISLLAILTLSAAPAMAKTIPGSCDGNTCLDDAVYYSGPDREDPIQNQIDTLKRRIDELDKVQVQLIWENVDLRDEIKHLKAGK